MYLENEVKSIAIRSAVDRNQNNREIIIMEKCSAKHVNLRETSVNSPEHSIETKELLHTMTDKREKEREREKIANKFSILEATLLSVIRKNANGVVRLIEELM